MVKKHILKKFVGLNDWNNNSNLIKRARNILDKEVNRYYKEINSNDKDNKIVKDDQSKHRITEVIMPLEYYISRFQHNISLNIRNCQFRSIKMKRFTENFDIISRLFIDEDKSIEYVAKWMRMSNKTLEKWITTYFRAAFRRSASMKNEIITKFNRTHNIKGLIEICLSWNKGKWVNTKSILSYIQNGNLDREKNPF